MEYWQKILQNSITTLDGLQEHLDCDSNALLDVIANFPMRINPYFFKLIHLMFKTAIIADFAPSRRIV